MLTRAESRRKVSTSIVLFCSVLTGCAVAQAIDAFILDLGLKETNTEKRRKITALALDEEEWTRVRLFCNVLQVSHTH
jgi:hypothetical protein